MRSSLNIHLLQSGRDGVRPSVRRRDLLPRGGEELQLLPLLLQDVLRCGRSSSCWGVACSR